jgi:dephospho-CoA kinase
VFTAEVSRLPGDRIAYCHAHVFEQLLCATAGEVDREALGELVFYNPAERRRLNAATHLPVLVAIFQELLKHWFTCTPVVVSISARVHDSLGPSWCLLFPDA